MQTIGTPIAHTRAEYEDIRRRGFTGAVVGPDTYTFWENIIRDEEDGRRELEEQRRREEATPAAMTAAATSKAMITTQYQEVRVNRPSRSPPVRRCLLPTCEAKPTRRTPG